MVTIKRYIGNFRKPFGWRRVGYALRYVVLPAVVAVSLMVVVRYYVATQYVVETENAALKLMAGDRILVVRTAYAFGRTPMRGDVVAYQSPQDSMRIAVGRIAAIPGDTLVTPQNACLLPDMYAVDGEVIYRTLITGRVACVTYSVIPDAPFYRCLRRGRFLRSVATLK